MLALGVVASYILPLSLIELTIGILPSLVSLSLAGLIALTDKSESKGTVAQSELKAEPDKKLEIVGKLASAPISSPTFSLPGSHRLNRSRKRVRPSQRSDWEPLAERPGEGRSLSGEATGSAGAGKKT